MGEINANVCLRKEWGKFPVCMVVPFAGNYRDLRYITVIDTGENGAPRILEMVNREQVPVAE